MVNITQNGSRHKSKLRRGKSFRSEAKKERAIHWMKNWKFSIQVFLNDEEYLYYSHEFLGIPALLVNIFCICHIDSLIVKRKLESSIDISSHLYSITLLWVCVLIDFVIQRSITLFVFRLHCIRFCMFYAWILRWLHSICILYDLHQYCCECLGI